MGQLAKAFLTDLQKFCNIESMQIVNFDEQIIQLQPRGVFTVPKRLREGLFGDSGVARIKRVGSRLIIEPVRVLMYPVRSYMDSEIDEFFKLDEEETKKLKAKGLI